MASVGLIDGNYVSGSRGYGSWMLYDVVCSIAGPGKAWEDAEWAEGLLYSSCDQYWPRFYSLNMSIAVEYPSGFVSR
jgi:hypothetical protein